MRATPKTTILVLLLAVSTLASAEQSPAKDAEAWQTAVWSQWRGPNRDGVSAEIGFATNWSENPPRELWRRSLGHGFSAIVVAQGNLYTQFAVGDDSFLAALSAKDGTELWRVRLGDNFRDSYGNGPRATPTLDDGVLYALSSNGDLAAVRAADGEVVWKVDTQKTYKARPPRWGLSGSPLIEGDLVVVNTGGEGHSVLALEKKSGKLRWSVRDDKAGYSAPMAITSAGMRQILVFLNDKMVSLSPDDGTTYWEFGWKTDWGVNATTPIQLDGDRLFLSTGYDRGAVMLRLRKEGDGVVAEQLWRSREMRNKFSSSVLYGGMLYGFDEATLKCLDPEAGTTVWKQRGLGHGSLIAADGKLIMLSDRGKLVLAEATADGYKELGSIQAFETKTWTAPTLAGGRLYLRDEKEVVAFDVSK